MYLNDSLITKVAWYYYMEGMTQEQIANYFNISRIKVIKLLDQARQENIVQFRIKGKGVHCLKIEQELQKHFNLLDVFVIPKSPNMLTRSLALAASQYLEEKIQPNDIIGLGWGETISKTVENLHIDPEMKLSFVSLTGGVKYYIPNSNSPSSANINRFNAKLYIIPSPFYVSSEDMAIQTLSEPSVKEILELASIANYFLVGIGSLSNDATVVREGNITENEMEILSRQGAIGDILGQFYDCNGNKLDTSIHKRLISFDINALKSKNNVIGIAGGHHKVQSIRGAINGGYIDILITDEDTAKELLEFK